VQADAASGSVMDRWLGLWISTEIRKSTPGGGARSLLGVQGSAGVAYIRGMYRRPLLILLLALVVLAPVELLAQGCAMCKAVVESGEEASHAFGGEQAIGKGLNAGILYLMAVPYVLLFLLFRKRIVSFVKEFAGAQG
jgi:hypothetical protein